MFNATIVEGKLSFGRQKAELVEYLASHDGKRMVLAPEKKGVSNNLRGYLFGAVIPLLKRLVPSWDTLESEQVYEVLKAEFNSFEAYNPRTERMERFGQSVMASGGSAEDASTFIRDIGEWVLENYGRKLPDPEKYKKWKDSAPMVGEVYQEDNV